MPYSVDSPPEAARKYKPKCRRAFVHAFNSVHDRTKDEGKAMAAGHAAAQRCEGKRSSMQDIKFKIFSQALKAAPTGEDGIRRLKTTASSTIRDLSGDTMTLKALQRMAASAKDNMTIYLNHKYEVPESVLGSVEDATITQRGMDDKGNPVWDMDFDIKVENANPRAIQTHDMIQNGTKLGTSIGALIPAGGAKMTEDGLLIDDVQLLEASIVGIPANPRSFVHYAVKAYEAAEAGEDDNTEVIETEKAKVWVTVDTADEGEETPSTPSKAKPKGDKAKKSEPAIDGSDDPIDHYAKQLAAGTVSESRIKDLLEEQVAKGADLRGLSVDEAVALVLSGDEVVAGGEETTTETDETAGPPKEGEETDEDEAAEEQPGNTDVPATQEAPESGPESDGEEDDTASDVVGKSFEALQIMVRAANEDLVITRQALADETQKRVAAEAELGEAKKGLKLAMQIVERIAALPLGRRAGFSSEVSAFRTKFVGLYSDDVIELMEK